MVMTALLYISGLSYLKFFISTLFVAPTYSADHLGCSQGSL